MPTNSPQVKVDGTRSYGAEVVCTTRYRAARRCGRPPHGPQPVRAGAALQRPARHCRQGTVAWEIYADLPAVDLVLVPVGGGYQRGGGGPENPAPSVKIIGMIGAGCRCASLRRRPRRGLAAADTSAPWPTGTDLELGDLTFAHIQRYVDDIVTVTKPNSGRRRRLLTEAG
jgi:threonine dehydratase